MKKIGPGTRACHSSSYKTSSEKVPLLVMYYLATFDNVIESDFRVIRKITSANLWTPIHDIINYSTFICPFKSEKGGKEGRKLQKFEYLKNKKSFLDEVKIIFHSFWRTIIWWKDK